MHLIFVHQYFYPEVAGAAIRLTELAVGLQERGYEVTVYTGLGSYTGPQALPRRENYRGVAIHRLGMTRFDRGRVWGRVANAITFFVRAFLKVLASDPDALLLLGSDPPFLGALGWLVRRLRGQRYLLHISDLYPHLARELGYVKPGSRLEQLWHRVNRLAFAEAERIVTLGEDMRRAIGAYLPEERRNKVVVVQNWEDGEMIQPIAKAQNWFARHLGVVEKTVVLYSGNMGRAHELASVVEAAHLLREERDIVFLFIGDGAQRDALASLAKSKNLRSVWFLPYQPLENLPYTLTVGDIALVTLKQGLAGLCVPGKFYSALAAGSAILAVVPADCEVARLTQEHRCGVHLGPGDAESMAAAIYDLARDSDLLREFRQNARRCFEAYYSKDRAVEAYDRIVQGKELVEVARREALAYSSSPRP